jgi:hypothetical protein
VTFSTKWSGTSSRPAVAADKAARLRSTLERFFPEAIVTGYEPLVAAVRNDAKDRHVGAVAVKAGAGHHDRQPA